MGAYSRLGAYSDKYGTLHVSKTCLCRTWNEVIDTQHF